MIILRNNSYGQYVVFPKATVTDPDLNLVDRGMMLTLLSLPDNWVLTISGLVAILKDGKDSVRNSLKRLEKIGYITRYQDRSSGKFAHTIIEIHDRLDERTEKYVSDIQREEEPVTGTIIRNIQEGGFVNVPMSTAKDKSLRLADKGMFLTMLSLPNNWQFSLRGMETRLPDGKTAIGTCMNNLEFLGYITRYQRRSINGQLSGMVIEIHDKPVPESQRTMKGDIRPDPADARVADFKTPKSTDKAGEMSKSLINTGFAPCPENPHPGKPHTENPPCPEKPHTEKPHTEKPHTEKPHTEKPPLSNNKESNTHLSSTQEVSTRTAADTLSDVEYVKLVLDFSKAEVDYQIQKINERHYKNCMNPYTIRQWCLEARAHNESSNKPAQQRDNRFNNFNQRQYDYSELEQQLLSVGQQQ